MQVDGSLVPSAKHYSAAVTSFIASFDLQA